MKTYRRKELTIEQALTELWNEGQLHTEDKDLSDYLLEHTSVSNWFPGHAERNNVWFLKYPPGVTKTRPNQ